MRNLKNIYDANEGMNGYDWKEMIVWSKHEDYESGNLFKEHENQIWDQKEAKLWIKG